MQRMPDVSSNATQTIQHAEACGYDKRNAKKRLHKRKSDDSHKENELIEQATAADDKKHSKDKNHKRKRDDDSLKGTELIEQERQSEVVDANKKKPKKRHHKRMRDVSHEENELIKQEMQSKVVAADNKKHTKIRHHKRKRDDSHKQSELKQEIQSKAVAVDNKKHTKKRSGKTERDDSATSAKDQINKGKKTVRFSSEVEVYHSTKNLSSKFKSAADGLVLGKRFTKEEDQIIKDACFKYVEDHNLEGVKMILNCRKYPEARGCWKEICAAIPWRLKASVYDRAAYIFRDRNEFHKWTPEEIKLIQSYVDEHGRQFKELADLLNVHRHQVKDAWRRNRHPDARKGHWSLDEYQRFFELVNEDLKLKSFEDKNTKPMIREDISWWAISDKMKTRYDPNCCLKWYNQLTSPMVSQGLWSSCDDYRLLFNLSKLDACCFEDVDWDNLLKNREGNTCRKRWFEMTKHIGGNIEKPFMEQVELLSSRYHIDVLPYRKMSLSEPDSESEGSESDREAEQKNM